MADLSNRVLFWALAPALLLLVPLVAGQMTDEVNWTGPDFAVAASILCGAGLAYGLVKKRANSTTLRLGAALVILGAVIVIWGSLVS
jgi:hypothetical protein